MGKSKLTALSPAETEILRIIWLLGSSTVQQVLKQLPPGRNITYATVQTLLRRLEKKGYIKHKKDGKAFQFSPAVKQTDVISKTVNEFVQRLFGGDPVPLMQYLAEHDKITVEDIENLKKLLDKKTNLLSER